jgi:hypothetical protein
MTRFPTVELVFPPHKWEWKIKRLMLYYGSLAIAESRLEFSACISLKSDLNSDELERLLRDYLEAKFGLTLDYFIVEGGMAPDAQGDMGVTGSYRKKAGDKKVFFTVTVNVASRKIQNLQEY